MKFPAIAIVGRPNVGKSSLLNALARKKISIVEDMPGVTRDRVAYHLPIDGKYIEIVDTGGYGFNDETGLTEHIEQQIRIAVDRADLVLLVCDATAGLTAADKTIALMLRKKNVKTIVIANKIDGPKSDPLIGDFSRLGFGNPIAISATNDRNLDVLLDAVRENLDLTNAPTDLPPPAMHLAIVGKRNAGKSTLVNAIARLYEDDPQRVIVSEVAGTTRDSIDVRFEKDGHALIVIDTAGMRKKRHMVTNDIEFYSFHRAERSIRRADVVLFLIDASEPLSDPDKKLAAYVAGEFKPVIMVVNKWDLARQAMAEGKEEGEKKVRDVDLMDEYGKYLDAELRFLDFAPIAFTTAKDGKNIQQVLDLAQNLFKQSSERVSTGKLNAAVESVLKERAPSSKKSARPKVYYATQVAVNPPTLVLFVNNPDYIDENYRRFVVNRFRELLPYSEVPIRLQVRGRARAPLDLPGKPANAADAKQRRKATLEARKKAKKEK
ncbi:MAG TPA: ribosome biogenesis GTPase Der [Tepidisphaeraceae bacterium]|jgi:GTP-binding protein